MEVDAVVEASSKAEARALLAPNLKFVFTRYFVISSQNNLEEEFHQQGFRSVTVVASISRENN